MKKFADEHARTLVFNDKAKFLRVTDGKNFGKVYAPHALIFATLIRKLNRAENEISLPRASYFAHLASQESSSVGWRMEKLRAAEMNSPFFSGLIVDSGQFGGMERYQRKWYPGITFAIGTDDANKQFGYMISECEAMGILQAERTKDMIVVSTYPIRMEIDTGSAAGVRGVILVREEGIAQSFHNGALEIKIHDAKNWMCERQFAGGRRGLMFEDGTFVPVVDYTGQYAPPKGFGLLQLTVNCGGRLYASDADIRRPTSAGVLLVAIDK